MLRLKFIIKGFKFKKIELPHVFVETMAQNKENAIVKIRYILQKLN